MKWRQYVQPVGVILAIMLITGCVGVQIPPTIIFQDDTHLVRLDRDRSIGGPDDPDRHTHPIEMGVDQIFTIFDSIRVEEHRALLQRTFMGPAKQMRVFSQHDITVFAPKIREALLQASPQEHVIFALINPVGKRNEVTAGEMFVQGSKLHIILNCVQSIDSDNGMRSLCGAIRQQGYELSFTEKEYFVGFGSQFFGRGKKEIIVDYAAIPSSPSSATLSTTIQTSSTPLEPTALPEPQPQPLEPEDSLDDSTDQVTGIEHDRIQMLERKVEELTQAIRLQNKARELRAPVPQSRPTRILFLTTPPMRGKDVAALQRALGFSPEHIDGIFGKQTDHAVRALQRQAGMTIDGKVAPDTLNAIASWPYVF